MILTLLQRTKTDDDILLPSSHAFSKRNRIGPLTGSNHGLSLTRSEEFLNGTHDIFDILVLQNTNTLPKGDKQAP